MSRNEPKPRAQLRAAAERVYYDADSRLDSERRAALWHLLLALDGDNPEEAERAIRELLWPNG